MIGHGPNLASSQQILAGDWVFVYGKLRMGMCVGTWDLSKTTPAVRATSWNRARLIVLQTAFSTREGVSSFFRNAVRWVP